MPTFLTIGLPLQIYTQLHY